MFSEENKTCNVGQPFSFLSTGYGSYNVCGPASVASPTSAAHFRGQNLVPNLGAYRGMQVVTPMQPKMASSLSATARYQNSATCRGGHSEAYRKSHGQDMMSGVGSTQHPVAFCFPSLPLGIPVMPAGGMHYALLQRPLLGPGIPFPLTVPVAPLGCGTTRGPRPKRQRSRAHKTPTTWERPRVGSLVFGVLGLAEGLNRVEVETELAELSRLAIVRCLHGGQWTNLVSLPMDMAVSGKMPIQAIFPTQMVAQQAFSVLAGSRFYLQPYHFSS